MSMPVVTALYAGILGFVGLLLASRVVQNRQRHRIALGDNGNEDMQRAMRVFGNFTEYVPMILLLMGFGEMLGAHKWITHTIGAGLVIGRLLHAFGLSQTSGTSLGRLVGTVLTWLALLISSAMLIWLALGQMT
ncbi:MAG: MAPEG family protein [Rhodospirillaceae bacterium]|nr:MAPEG family protein [Rhodospirillaceae bacterium]